LSIPGTIIGHIYLYMAMNKRGRESLVGTPFASDEVEKGFTLSQIASSIVSGARHLISFGSKGSRRHSVTKSDSTNSNGFIASNFTIVNKPAAGSWSKELVPPVVAPPPPLNFTAPAPAKMSSNGISVSATVIRPTSPFSRPLFRTGAGNGLSQSAGVISVVKSSHRHQDSLEDAELAQVINRARSTPHAREFAAVLRINVSDAIAEDDGGVSVVGEELKTKAKGGRGVQSTQVATHAMDKTLPSVPAS
jgi:hypothetical protein